MTKCEVSFPLPLPDDPNKWDGWNRYKSSNLYERLCLDSRTNPSNELIEEHCRELLRWWQKKLPLKNQPSNPLAQLLRSGLDESSRYLTEARVELLDPSRRRQMDDEIAAHAHEESVAEFHKYVAFVLANGVLTPADEKSLIRFGAEHHLTEEEMTGYIEAELRDNGAQRAPALAEPVESPAEAANGNGKKPSLNPQDDFLRMLRLSGLNSDDLTDDQRDAFVNMGENLGIEPSEAEDLIDLYLDEADELTDVAVPPPPVKAKEEIAARPAAPQEAEKPAAIDVEAERARYSNFENSAGDQMLFVPSGEFIMGSEVFDAAPNERPLARMSISRFFMARHLITNAQYEQFDPSHSRKRAPGAGDSHPVVYVSHIDATKFCQWLGARERRKYRLPSEAEWEYAAKGTDGRKFPWGNYEGRGDLANFADKNTVFAWSDREVDDGYAESSPVGSYPIGRSPFGVEDMAGNVWEWCLDYYEAYRGTPKANPRGPGSGTKKVYRGGSWKSRFNSLRTTARGSNLSSYSCNDLGFRVVCECE